MRITWDPEAKAVYIYVRTPDQGADVAKTEVIEDGSVNVDRNPLDDVVGIEILGVEAEPFIEKNIDKLQNT